LVAVISLISEVSGLLSVYCITTPLPAKKESADIATKYALEEIGNY
jgi:hypothetical protein